VSDDLARMDGIGPDVQSGFQFRCSYMAIELGCPNCGLGPPAEYHRFAMPCSLTLTDRSPRRTSTQTCNKCGERFTFSAEINRIGEIPTALDFTISVRRREPSPKKRGR
jgi:hypothetical protein